MPPLVPVLAGAPKGDAVVLLPNKDVPLEEEVAVAPPPPNKEATGLAAPPLAGEPPKIEPPPIAGEDAPALPPKERDDPNPWERPTPVVPEVVGLWALAPKIPPLVVVPAVVDAGAPKIPPAGVVVALVDVGAPKAGAAVVFPPKMLDPVDGVAEPPPNTEVVPVVAGFEAPIPPKTDVVPLDPKGALVAAVETVVEGVELPPPPKIDGLDDPVPPPPKIEEPPDWVAVLAPKMPPLAVVPEEVAVGAPPKTDPELGVVVIGAALPPKTDPELGVAVTGAPLPPKIDELVPVGAPPPKTEPDAAAEVADTLVVAAPNIDLVVAGVPPKGLALAVADALVVLVAVAELNVGAGVEAFAVVKAGAAVVVTGAVEDPPPKIPVPLEAVAWDAPPNMLAPGLAPPLKMDEPLATVVGVAAPPKTDVAVAPPPVPKIDLAAGAVAVIGWVGEANDGTGVADLGAGEERKTGLGSPELMLVVAGVTVVLKGWGDLFSVKLLTVGGFPAFGGSFRLESKCSFGMVTENEGVGVPPLDPDGSGALLVMTGVLEADTAVTGVIVVDPIFVILRGAAETFLSGEVDFRLLAKGEILEPVELDELSVPDQEEPAPKLLGEEAFIPKLGTSGLATPIPAGAGLPLLASPDMENDEDGLVIWNIGAAVVVFTATNVVFGVPSPRFVSGRPGSTLVFSRSALVRLGDLDVSNFRKRDSLGLWGAVGFTFTVPRHFR